MSTLRTPAPVIAAFVLVAAVAALGPVGCASDFGLPSVESDVVMGREVTESLGREIGFVEDPSTTALLEAIGQRLAAKMEDQRFTYRFHVLDQAESNAFAAPGGYVFVSRGLLAVVNSEDELAGVVAHEMAHVSRRHSARQMARAQGPDLLTLPGRAIGAAIGGGFGASIAAPFERMRTGFAASYSRQDENEADADGVVVAASAGYDPEALAVVLDRIEAEAQTITGATRRRGFFDTHPTTPDRIDRIGRAAQRQNPGPAAGVTSSRTAFLRTFEGMIVGQNPAHGIVRGERFLHADLDFSLTFPDGWSVLNNAVMVGASDPDGMTLLVIRARGDDPEPVARQFIDSLTTELALEPVRDEPFTDAAVKAHIVEIRTTNDREPVSIHFVWYAHAGVVYQMFGLTRTSDTGTFLETARSFKPLDAAARTSIRRLEYRIAEARAGETIKTLSDRTRNAWSPARTALMNGLDRDAPIAAGTPVKIVLSRQYGEREGDRH